MQVKHGTANLEILQAESCKRKQPEPPHTSSSFVPAESSAESDINPRDSNFVAPPLEHRNTEMSRHEWESQVQDSLPHFTTRLREAIHELHAIKAITPSERDELLDMLQGMFIKDLATSLAKMLENYSDDSAVPTNPKYPTLKRITFRPRIYEILTKQFLQENIREYVLRGFREGFKSGWEGFSVGRRVSENPQLTEEGEAAVLGSVLKDWRKGIIAVAEKWGDDDCMAEVVISPVYTVAKRFMGYPVEGKRRRVFNLSKRFVKKSNRVRKHLPSVNDDIDAELFRCSFAKLSDAIDMIRKLREKGESVYMAKADVEDAFTNIPVRDDEMHLMAFSCEIDFDDPAVELPVGVERLVGKHRMVFVNSRFPFGLRSAPAVFETIAQTVRQIARFMFNVNLSVGYLDDVLILQTSKARCEDDLAIYIAVLRMIGLAPQLTKCSTEAVTKLDFLGIDIDTIKQEVSMPELRIQRMKEILEEWAVKTSCTRVELESLIGTMQHMTKGVPAGRMFLRRAIDLLWDKGPRRGRDCEEEEGGIPFGMDADGEEYAVVGGAAAVPPRHRHPGRVYALTSEFHLDIQWWRENMEKFNHRGFPFLTDCPPENMEFELATDASDIGFGGRFGNEWFAYEWAHGEAERYSIAYRELFAVVVAVCTWGHLFKGKIIHFWNDNTNTILAAKKATTRDPQMMHLLRALHSLCVDFQMHVWFDYINTKDNSIADALSRLDFKRFHTLLPTALASPSPVQRTVPSHYNAS
jgi:hypothetical protein